jgi:hypothetical protein
MNMNEKAAERSKSDDGDGDGRWSEVYKEKKDVCNNMCEGDR